MIYYKEPHVTKRIQELNDLDMIFDSHNSYVGCNKINKDFNVDLMDIRMMNKTKWNSLIKELKEEIERIMK